MQGMGSERETEQGTTRGWGGGSARVSQHRPAWQGDVPRGHSWRGGGRTRASLGHRDLRPKTLWNAHVQRPGPWAQAASWPGHLVQKNMECWALREGKLRCSFNNILSAEAESEVSVAQQIP